jgi:hypothetical protein
VLVVESAGKFKEDDEHEDDDEVKILAKRTES